MQKQVTIINFDEIEEIKQLLNHAKDIATEVRNGDMHISNNDWVIDDISKLIELFD